MGQKNFWKDAAKYGAIIGGLLAVSTILENRLLLSGNISMFTALAVEFLVVVVLHYYLLHRYTRSYSKGFTAEEGFTFGQGYGFVLMMSIVAGVIVGIAQYVSIHLVIGAESYTTQLADSMYTIMAAAGTEMSPLMASSLEQMQNAPVPTAIGTIWGGLWTSLLFGGIFGLIIAGVISRAAKPFEPKYDE